MISTPIQETNTYLGSVNTQEELDVIKHLNITELGVYVFGAKKDIDPTTNEVLCESWLDKADYRSSLRCIVEYVPYFNKFIDSIPLKINSQISNSHLHILKRSYEVLIDVADFRLLDSLLPNSPAYLIKTATKRVDALLKSLNND